MNDDIIEKIALDMDYLEPKSKKNELIEVDMSDIENAKDAKDVEVIKFQTMKDDLEYTIAKLKNNVDNSERLLNKLTLDMLQEDDDIDAMTLRYTSLDAGMNKNLELLQKARKDISIVMANLQKAKTPKVAVKSITNNLTLDGGAISTTDIIAQLKEK